MIRQCRQLLSCRNPCGPWTAPGSCTTRIDSTCRRCAPPWSTRSTPLCIGSDCTGTPCTSGSSWTHRVPAGWLSSLPASSVPGRRPCFCTRCTRSPSTACHSWNTRSTSADSSSSCSCTPWFSSSVLACRRPAVISVISGRGWLVYIVFPSLPKSLRSGLGLVNRSGPTTKITNCFF